MTSAPLDGRSAIVTGAGSGLGRAEALALAAAGADVVVNDVGSCDQVVAEIEALGRRAVAVSGDAGDWANSDAMVEAAVDTFGRLDIIVNNAGIVRDAMIFNLSESDWDDVLRVHLKGHAGLCRAGGIHWRRASKAAGGPVYGRIVNTTSESFLFGAPGQPNYAAAKSGITALTLSCARGLDRYGVRTNAIAPRARTQMTEGVFAEQSDTEGLDILAPERVATFVTYLASPQAENINGQVFVVYGKMVALMAAPQVERKFETDQDAFSFAELDSQLAPHFAGRSPYQTFAAFSVAKLDDTGTQQG